MTAPTEPVLHIEGAQATCALDTRLYSVDALKKAAYRLADRCTVAFGALQEFSVAVTIMAASEADAVACVRAFLDEALDQDLREKIGAATAPLRDLILAHAFSRTTLIEKP